MEQNDPFIIQFLDMGKKMSFLKRSYRVFVALICVFLLAVLCFFGRVHPIEFDLSEDEEMVFIDLQYTDYMGYEQSRLISERKIIRQLNKILIRIQGEKPKRVLKTEKKSGPITYFFVVKKTNEEFHYSLQGEYLAVGERGLFKNFTIYKLSPDSSDELISFFRSVSD